MCSVQGCSQIVDREQRSEVLEPALGEDLALLPEVAGEEDDQHDLRQLAGLELDAADVHPEPRAVDGLADDRQHGQHEEPDRGQAEDVLVALQPPVVVAERHERAAEGRDADHDPEPLPEGVVGVEAVDLGDADRRQERRHRQQIGIRLRDGQARDHVRGEVEGEEEERVGERAGRDDLLAGDVHAREPEPGDDRDDEEVCELAVPEAERHWLWPKSQ